MDKLKKYIRENEHRLNMEQVGDDVWNNISAALDTSVKHVPTPQNNKYSWKWLRGYRMTYRRWALALVVPVLFIISCTYKIKHIEQLGSIITLNIQQENVTMAGKISSLQSFLGLYLWEAKNVQPHLLSFVGFVKHGETFKIHRIKNEVSDAAGDVQFAVIPVEKTTSESLFSWLVYKIFNKHVDLKQTGAEDIDKNISKQLKTKGIQNINVHVSEVKGEVMISVQGDTPMHPGTAPVNEVQDSARRKKSSPPPGDTNHKQISRADVAKKDKHGPIKEFSWILHTWRTIDSSQNTWHRWIKINDTLYRSFLLRLEPNGKITSGYFLYKKDGLTVLARDNNSWVLTETTADTFLFQRESQQFPHQVLWVLNNKKWRFDLIRGSLKDQVHLYTDDSRNRELDSVLNNYRKNNP